MNDTQVLKDQLQSNLDKKESNKSTLIDVEKNGKEDSGLSKGQTLAEGEKEG
jgi:hypothetical protein